MTVNRTEPQGQDLPAMPPAAIVCRPDRAADILDGANLLRRIDLRSAPSPVPPVVQAPV